ncbi:carboxylating nicotinate-nucleotide diphosphorylase [Romboutsia weinsteinii]|uniref:Probable nicotinate-nucleotide pyrophosphorylase [carboxylating] n=1 Tax=Romboutsia weinsteinii TaxID=2020949 RepID=A0A371J697_9FIRM|nr:carboxylating nicotinate-nucleotide diphosphorylase [Romboutsia weinsteinii]RDY28310.1 carboxylating nicotinate-nucleotide diphosphorylase [Romboutsia weinsteinii]
MNYLIIDNMIKEALIEDIPNEDITTNSIISESANSTVDLICKEDGIICGLDVFKRVFDIIGNVGIEFFKKDGESVRFNEKIAILKGSTRNILKGERVALNYLQRMSGISTKTNMYVQKLKNSNTKLLDTRKTMPNNRILDKYAVKLGGGVNHRHNLSDGILLKDNHIDAAGGVINAITLVKNNCPFVRKIEVEAETIAMVRDALEAGADIIMLDNMDIKTASEAVKIIGNNAITEFSGNITIDKIEKIAEIGVDFISVGELTHSVKALDISMKNLVNI